MDSLGRTYGSSGSLEFALVNSGAATVHLDPRGFAHAVISAAVFIGIRIGSRGCDYGSSVSFRLA